MARVKRAVGAKKKRRQVLERAKGYYGNKSRSVRAANEQVMDPAHQCGLPSERHQLQPIHRRPQRRRDRSRPQDPR